MLPIKQPEGATALRKLQPTAKMPTQAVLGTLTAADAGMLQRRLIELIECVFNRRFARPESERLLMRSLAELDSARRSGSQADNDDSGLDLFAKKPSRGLTGEQEQHLFLKLNYARYRAMRILHQFNNKRLSAAAARELLRWESATVDTRVEIVRANVPLVLAMAKRTKLTGVDYADLISEGNLALLRSVDKFDVARGFKFSTYACRAILKSFSRVASRTARYRGHFPTEYDPVLEKSDFVEKKRVDVAEDCVDELKSILGSNVANLNDVERRVILARFALDEPRDEPIAPKAKTLEQVGQMIGVTKERVRQIQNKALHKLRSALESGVLAVR